MNIASTMCNKKGGEKMYLVIIEWVGMQKDTYCVVAETEDKAQEYIEKQMEGKQPSGMGYYKIIPIELYE